MSISPEEKRVLNAYFDMLEETSKEHAELERKMDQIESGIRSILALQTDEDAEIMPFLEKLDDIRRPEGFTEAIRKVMRTSGEALTPREVKNSLADVGFPIDGYSNPLASVHTILRRLHKAGELDIAVKGGKGAYKLAHPLRQLAAKPERVRRNWKR